MWDLKLVAFHKDCIFAGKTQDSDITLMGYPLGWYKRDGKVHFKLVGFLKGDEESKKKFLSDLKRDRRIEKIDAFNDLFFTEYAECPKKAFYTSGYNPALIFPVPVVIRNGFEYWEIASWNRDHLEQCVGCIEENREHVPEFDIVRFAKTKLNDVFMPKIMPELSPMQKKVFEFASENGYYSYPRKADMKKLSSAMNIHVTTFSEHLRKAEAKLLPFIAKSATGEF